MSGFLRGFAMVLGAGALVMTALIRWPSFDASHAGTNPPAPETMRIERKKTTEELIAEVREKSSKIKALYMTADAASDGGAGAARLRREIIRLAEETEINGIVIDVKEVCGPDYDEAALGKLLKELHEKKIWVIARIAAFKDASQREIHQEWYLTRRTPKKVFDSCSRKGHLVVRNPSPPVSGVPLWQDNKGGYWLDPASDAVREYLASFGKKMIDLGFDELQFDYVRFPSDGDVFSAVYPAWDGKTPKYAVMKSFFEYLSKTLKTYKPDVILSVDIFGYVALQREDETIGQRLEDVGESFDYVSFMVYPSHYYNGLRLPADAAHDFAAVNFTFSEARSHPDVVVQRSLQAARDYFDRIYHGSGVEIASSSSLRRGTAEIAISGRDFALNGASSTATRIRPWLEDFFHEDDRAAARPWGAQKVRSQIDAAETVENHGWMLWNASNVYSEGALKEE